MNTASTALVQQATDILSGTAANIQPSTLKEAAQYITKLMASEYFQRFLSTVPIIYNGTQLATKLKKIIQTIDLSSRFEGALKEFKLNVSANKYNPDASCVRTLNELTAKDPEGFKYCQKVLKEERIPTDVDITKMEGEVKGKIKLQVKGMNKRMIGLQLLMVAFQIYQLNQFRVELKKVEPFIVSSQEEVKEIKKRIDWLKKSVEELINCQGQYKKAKGDGEMQSMIYQKMCYLLTRINGVKGDVLGKIEKLKFTTNNKIETLKRQRFDAIANTTTNGANMVNHIISAIPEGARTGNITFAVLFAALSVANGVAAWKINEKLPALGVLLGEIEAVDKELAPILKGIEEVNKWMKENSMEMAGVDKLLAESLQFCGCTDSAGSHDSAAPSVTDAGK